MIALGAAGWIRLAIVGALIAAGGLAWMYYKDTQATIQQLTADKALLDTANKQKQLALEQQEQWRQQQTLLMNDLQAELRAAETDAEKLQSILAKHNLEKLATDKPGLIERRINDATRRAFDAIECDTGIDDSCQLPE